MREGLTLDALKMVLGRLRSGRSILRQGVSGNA